MEAHRYQALAILLLAVTLLSTRWTPASAGFFSRLVSLRFGEEVEVDDIAKKDINVRVENGVVFAGLWDAAAKIPLVGAGVGGYADPHAIPALVAEALQDDKRTRLFDTSPISGTEGLVAEGIVHGLDKMNLSQKLEVHVVTKIWYTHLGYHRTKLAVEESMRALDPVVRNPRVDLRIHFLLHWPRCFDSIHPMNCRHEEANLPQQVKEAGPDPNLNPEGAWKESWRLLEDIYTSKTHPIESIGVANFRLQDMQQFGSFARVRPSMNQVNLWSLIYDHQLIRYCHEHNIHVQVYNIMQRTLLHPETAPRAYHHIQKVAVDTSTATGPRGPNYSPVQILFAWLIQHGVSIVPGASKVEHVADNSALAVTSIPPFNTEQVETLAHAVEAYLCGTDMDTDTPILVTFVPTSRDIMVYWLHDVDEVKLGLVRPGQMFKETTYPGHFFRFYDAKNKDLFLDFQVQANVGSHVTVYVDLDTRRINAEATPYGLDEL